MELRINGKTFETSDSCQIGGPLKSTLKRHLSQHGAESFLASNKYSKYAPCILDELQSRGAEVVAPIEVKELPSEPDDTSKEVIPDGVPVTPAHEAPEDA